MTGKLVVLRGERPGTEFHLLSNRAVLGRAEHVDIVVADHAASRQHVEITRDGAGFTLRDLNSGNGTFLNGKRVSFAELISGDRIGIGTHELNFLQLSGPGRDPQRRRIDFHNPAPSPPAAVRPPNQVRLPAAPAQPAAPPGQNVRVNVVPPRGPQTAIGRFEPAVQKKKASAGAIIAIIGFVLIALALAGVIGYQLYKRHKTAEPSSTELLVDHVAQGNAALAAQDFTLAKQHFNTAIDIDPNNAEASAGLDRAGTEEQMAALLEIAETEIGEGQYAAAVVTLLDVQHRSSLLAGAAQARLARLVDELVAEGRAAVDNADVARAEQLARIAADTAPNHAGATALRSDIQRLRMRADTSAPEAAIPSDSSTADLPPGEPTALAETTPAAPEESGRRGGDDSGRRGDDDDDDDDSSSSSGGSETPDDGTSAHQIAQIDEPDPPAATGDEATGEDGSEAETAAAPDDDGDSSAPAQTRRRSEPDLDDAWRYYDRGRFDDAIEVFQNLAEAGGPDAVEAGEYAERVESFRDYQAAGNEAMDTGDYSFAGSQFTRARGLDRLSLNGHYQSELNEHLAEAYYQQAREAFDAEDFRAAGRHAVSALRFNSEHDETIRLIRNLETPARNLLIQARAATPARSQQICREIIAMLPEGNETREDAQALLDSL